MFLGYKLISVMLSWIYFKDNFQTCFHFGHLIKHLSSKQSYTGSAVSTRFEDVVDLVFLAIHLLRPFWVIYLSMVKEIQAGAHAVQNVDLKNGASFDSTLQYFTFNTQLAWTALRTPHLLLFYLKKKQRCTSTSHSPWSIAASVN